MPVIHVLDHCTSTKRANCVQLLLSNYQIRRHVGVIPVVTYFSSVAAARTPPHESSQLGEQQRNTKLLNVFFFLTTVCVKLLGLYLPLYMFCCTRASVSGLMALLVLWLFPLNIHSFIQTSVPLALYVGSTSDQRTAKYGAKYE